MERQGSEPKPISLQAETSGHQKKSGVRRPESKTQGTASSALIALRWARHRAVLRTNSPMVMGAVDVLCLMGLSRVKADFFYKAADENLDVAISLCEQSERQSFAKQWRLMEGRRCRVYYRDAWYDATMHWDNQRSPRAILVKYKEDRAHESLDLHEIQTRLEVLPARNEPISSTSPRKPMKRLAPPPAAAVSSSAVRPSGTLSRSRARFNRDHLAGTDRNEVTFIDLTLESEPSPPAPPLTLASLLPGCRVEVWWSGDKKWLKGRVDRHLANGNITVEYEQGWFLEEPLEDAQKRPIIRLAGVNPLLARRNINKHSKSTYFGVEKRRSKWRVRRRAFCTTTHIGCFSTIEEAAMAYDDAIADAGLLQHRMINYPDRMKGFALMQPSKRRRKKRSIGQHSAGAPKKKKRRDTRELGLEKPYDRTGSDGTGNLEEERGAVAVTVRDVNDRKKGATDVSISDFNGEKSWDNESETDDENDDSDWAPAPKRKRAAKAPKTKENPENPEVMSSWSPYQGVYWSTESRRWRCGITINRKKVHLGTFDDEEAAARAFDAKVVELNLTERSLNFPTPEQGKIFGPMYSSRYRGVSWHKRTRSWLCYLYINSRTSKRFVGKFDSQESAARAYDAMIKKLNLKKPLNFPEETSESARKYRGVSWDEQVGKWKSSICINGRSRVIGHFNDQVSAARARDYEVKRLNLEESLNFPLSRETKESRSVVK